MALSTGLEPFRFERLRSSLRASSVLILIWTIWLVIFTTLPIPARISLHGTALVLLVGCYWWTIAEGAFYLLWLSFIFSAMSLTPSGFFWTAIFLVFLICRLGLSRITITARYQVLVFVFFIALFIELAQIILMNRMMGMHVFSWRLLLSVLYSASIQSFMGFLLARPILLMVGAR